jgi:uncharacterized membrane protein (DUF485 family)
MNWAMDERLFYSEKVLKYTSIKRKFVSLYSTIFDLSYFSFDFLLSFIAPFVAFPFVINEESRRRVILVRRRGSFLMTKKRNACQFCTSNFTAQ